MTQLRCTLVALLGLTLAACGDDPTVVAVNISYGEGIETTTETVVQVSIVQGGETVSDEFETPLRNVEQDNPDGGSTRVIVPVPDTEYFKRYTLGDGFGGGEATVTVKLLDGSRTAYTESAKFDIRENGATAVFVEFEIDPPDTSGDTSGSDTSSSAVVDGGSSTGETSSVDTASSSGDAGTSSAPVTGDGGSETGSSTSSDTGLDTGPDASSPDASATDAG